MPRPKRARKLSEEGIAKTLWLRLGTIRRAEREAQRGGTSLSVFAEEALRREIERREDARRVDAVA